jgi:hypothetical protein
MRVPVAFRMLFLSSALSAQQSVLLPSHENRAVTQLCSRESVAKIDGSWQPTPDVLSEMEAHLSDVQKLPHSLPIGDPSHSFRQYLAIIVSGRKLIYVNAMPISPRGWDKHFEDVCDGGGSFWGALYDPETKTFSELHTNGRA